MLNTEKEYVKMKAAEGKLWWYRILHEQVLKTIQAHFSSKDIKILDAGCGTGGLLSYLKEQQYANLFGFDLSPYAVNACKEREFHQVIQLDINDVSQHYALESFDIVVCNDMLYFIEDEKLPHLLSNIFKLIKPNGLLIVNLPAFNIFQGTHDVSVGIKNRWTYKRFRQQVLISQIEYRQLDYHYWPMLLSPLILAIRIFQKIKMQLWKLNKVESDVSVPSRPLNQLFYTLTKLESFLPFRKCFGSSLFIYLRKQ